MTVWHVEPGNKLPTFWLQDNHSTAWHLHSETRTSSHFGSSKMQTLSCPSVHPFSVLFLPLRSLNSGRCLFFSLLLIYSELKQRKVTHTGMWKTNTAALSYYLHPHQSRLNYVTLLWEEMHRSHGGDDDDEDLFQTWVLPKHEPSFRCSCPPYRDTWPPSTKSRTAGVPAASLERTEAILKPMSVSSWFSTYWCRVL